MAEFKNRIKELRDSRRMTQQELADAISVNKQTISQYERGVRKPRPDTLDLLCDFFNVSSDYLLGRDMVTSFYVDGEEKEIIEKYRDLEEPQRDMIRKMLGVNPLRVYIIKDKNDKHSYFPDVNAAHERTDVQNHAGDREYDESIMDNPEEWS